MFLYDRFFPEGSKIIDISAIELRDFPVKYELKLSFINVFAYNECIWIDEHDSFLASVVSEN